MSDETQLTVLPLESVLVRLETRLSGLSPAEVAERRARFGPNAISKRNVNWLAILIRQFTGNPLLIILGLATTVAFLLGQHVSSYYIFAMILLSVILGFWNEYSAEHTVEALLKRISAKALVVRGDAHEEVPVSDITVGDIVLLSQGSIVPADLRLLSVSDLAMNESALTGESKTRYKTADALPAAPRTVSDSANVAFMGTAVDSGSGRGVVWRIGKDTEFGKIAKSALFTKPKTDFEEGLTRFGSFLVKTIVVLAVGIFAINFALGRPALDSLLFALAIAVGLTPELLPVIVTISLSHGAGKLARKKVIAKQLIAIENIGNMDVLCTDKTGTLTEGTIELIEYANMKGERDQEVLFAALLANTAVVHRKVVGNGIDAAVWKYAIKNHIYPSPATVKVDEEPFDFNRKAMYTVVEHDGTRTLILNGSPDFVLSQSTEAGAAAFTEKCAALNRDGLRVVAIATKRVDKKETYTWEDAKGTELLGYTTFLDVPKASAKKALALFRDANVAVKIITGDNEIITEKVCREVGMAIEGIIVGPDIDALSDEQMKDAVNTHNIFARMTPERKMRVITALRASGHAVGYLGDGINDIPALRSADVGISVDSAVDVAKEAASVVILAKGLDVIAEGIIEGRKTFANTIKYILMGTSSNFGNMFSAAGASFFLPFLPMTPAQILLTNSLYDISQLSIPADNVDAESVLKPRHWNIGFIKSYMIFFGPVSSVFDFLTFGVMIVFFHAHGALFQTGWFIESMMTEILVVFVIRTSRTPFFLSRPGKWLLGTCLGIVGASVLLPFSPLAADLGFVAPPPLYFAILIVLVFTYLALVEMMKKSFLRRYSL